MGRRLITANNIQDYLNPDRTILFAQPWMILSPSALDYMREHGISRKEVSDKALNSIQNQEEKDILKKQIEKILKRDYNIENKEVVLEVLRRCIRGGFKNGCE